MSPLGPQSAYSNNHDANDDYTDVGRSQVDGGTERHYTDLPYSQPITYQE